MLSNKYRSRPNGSTNTNRVKTTGTFHLRNSEITVRETPAGPVGIVERPTGTRPNPEYALLSTETVSSLAEVAE